MTRAWGWDAPGNKDVVEAILDAGADINDITEMHHTPLDLALQFGHEAVADPFEKEMVRHVNEWSQ